MCPNVKLIGFSKKKADELIPLIVEVIKAKTSLAPKTVITVYPETQVVDVDTGKSRPYLCICNTREPGAAGENIILTSVLRTFSCDIEWGEIQEFFITPTFERWTGE